MRLRELKVRNIASLKGEHHVDFRDIESRSHLFAITGETGAGKSSLLNSIGLALYGKVFKNNVIQSDLVTLGEKDGEIQLLFEVKGRPYLANWKARVLKSNGEPYATPQSPSRELYELSSADFNSEKNISATKVEELLNLDFDQFCKCIILNQGEFARFLLSTFNERKEILEKLYPGEVLESLSRELKGELDSLTAEKVQIEAGLGTLTGDGADLTILESQKKDLTQKLEMKNQAQDQLKKINSAFLSAQTYHQNNGDYLLKRNQIQSEVERETVSFNEVLKQNEAASLKLQEMRRRLKTEEPRLMGLLEKELALRHAEDEKTKLENEIKRTRSEINLRAVSLKKLSDTQDEKEGKLAEITQSLPLPLTSLLTLKDQFTKILEVWKEKNYLTSEGELRDNQFKEVEARGHKLSLEIKALEEIHKSYPEEIPKKLETLTRKKADSQKLRESRQRLELELQKLKEDETQITKETLESKAKELKLKEEIEKIERESSPLQTTLKLQEVLLAVKTCLTHQESQAKGECPVCEAPVSEKRWEELRVISEKNDFGAIQKKVKELESRSIALSEELKHLASLIKKGELLLNDMQEKKKSIAEALKTPLESEQSLDDEIARLQKDAWELEKTLNDLKLKAVELEEVRKKYRSLRDLLNEHAKKKEKNSQDLSEVQALWNEHNLGSLTEDEIDKIRRSSLILPKYLELQKSIESLLQDIKLIKQEESQLLKEEEKKKKEFETYSIKAKEIKFQLAKEVGDSKVSELLEKLRGEALKAQENFDTQEQALKIVQNKLKDLQGRIFSYEEQMKAAESMFAAQIVKVREEARVSTAFEENDRDFLLKLSETSLSLTDVPELFSPVSDKLLEMENRLKTELNDLRGRISSIDTLRSETEKRLDRIKLLQLKMKDVDSRLQRLQRLSEVLGRDELRSFVLSMVEENLIHQTNLELGRLCQGRYEIIHQNKGKGLSPEFYILDKFREGQRRKVSTLSGGETFMVSLAMALGLAEMTRGQAEIDSLFIDEGFGTLDEESLEDVMEMLNQIQTRGLLVGVISHVKALTRSMPVNLNLSKKSDGTSTIGIRIN